MTEFKSKCLGLIEEIEKEGGSITITRRGRPVAILDRPKRKAFKSPKNMFAGKIKIVGDIVNSDTADLWEVVRQK